MSDVFSDSTNFVPFLNHNSGPRTIMGARQMGQAVSLEDPDTPAVDTVDSEGQSFSKKLGEKFVPKSDVSGTVSRVTKDAIHVEDEDGNEQQHPIFNNMPLNRGGYVNHEPEVEEGDEVSEGDVLAKNNYTDEEGKLAIGKNLRTAYMPFNGFNYEDAMVMSESGAQKLSSNHMYEKVMEVRENDRMGLDAYDSYLSDRGDELSNRSRQKLDSNGMIREGETVEQGDILMAGVGVADMRNEPGKNEQLSQIFENIGLDDEDRSVYWDKPFKGEVTKVKDTPKEKRVYVKSKEPMKEGDKISARDGGKGIVSKIVPDNKMPQTEDGRVPDVLVDPHGVPSRANPGQIFELAAGKLAKKKGEPYEVENFGSRKDWEELKEELDEEDVDVKEDLYDPQTGRKIPDVAMGHKYQAKLVHKLDKKFAARGINEGYDMDRQPTGGASMDNLTVHSMIGHNARANMAEMSNLKGTKNDDYWTDLATNQFTNRKAEVPYSFKKFQGMMESLGVNIERDSDDLLQVMPLTDEEIENQSSGAVQSAQAYETYRKPGSRGRNALDPFDKGLFDPNLIGESGKNRNHIELPEPVPNPTFTKGIQQTIERGLPASLDETPRIHKSDGRDRPVRDVAQKDIEDIYKGDASIEVDGKKYDGGDGLKEVLSMVDTEKTEEVVREKAENYMEGGDFQEQTAGDYKTALRYFTNLNDNDINPEDAFINEKIPVMRAEYRQPLVTSDGEIHNQPVNKLYAATIKGAGALKQAKDNVLPEETIKKRREGLLHDIGALYGGAGYEPRGDFKARSIMDQLAGGGASAGTQYYKSGDDDGKGPKTGYVQKKVMKKQQEPSGRSTIVPSGLKKYETTDALGIDEVGMPEEMAWKTFEPWVRKRLTRELGSAADAAEQFENRTTRARQALEEESKRRPVMLNRAPSWWPYNVTAHDPKIIEEDEDTENTEKAIRIPNMVVAPYQGGDFDGDSVSLNTSVMLRINGEIWKGQIKKLITESVGTIPSEDYIISFGSDVETLNSNGSWEQVSELTIHQTEKPTYEVETRGGYKIRVTSDHSMMVGGEEIKPQNLTEGEDVLDNVHEPVFGSDREAENRLSLPANEEAYTVRSVNQVKQESVVADMTVENNHVFCVGPGIIVHNTMSLHVPAEDEAIAEAESLKPSRNLRAPGSKKLMAHPDHSQLMGLHDLSLTSGDHPLAKGKGEPKEFQDVASIDDLVEKYNKDEIPVHQKVKIRDSKGDKDVWTPGWAMIDRSVRAGSNDNFGVEDILDKMKTDHPGSEGSLESTTFDDTTLNDKFMESLMRHHPDEYADVAHQLSMAGAKHATNMGFTTGFDDIKPEDDLAQRYYDGAEEKVREMAQQVAEEDGRDEPNEADKKEAMVNVFMSPKYELNGSEYKGAIQAMEDEIESRPGHNSMTRMMQVGSRGSSGQIRQLLGTVGLPKDVQKDFINEPIKSSLNRGLKGGEYFLEQHGTIKGLRDRAVETSKPGYLGKQIIASSQHQIITEKDCGTENGVEIPLHNDDGQLNMEELNGRVPAGEKDPLSGERLSAMERENVNSVEVRSPLTCEAERGICQRCYGMTANGNVPEIGDNVGVRSGQSLLEASTKMTLKSFHSTGEVDKTEPSFERFQELVQLKTPQIKASIAKGNPGEKFEVKEVNDIKAQGEQIGTEVKYESKDTGNVTSTQINNQHDIRDKVQPGNEFESGERFTNTGNYDIEELRSARGIKDAQDYLTNQLHNIFGEIGGINRRAAETAVRSMSDFGTIVDPGASDYAPGQKVRVGKIRAFNEEQDNEEDKINMKPQLHSMNKVPQLGDNWLAKLNFEDLKKHIRSAGIEGQGAEIHGTSPVASYMYGAELDKGDEEWQY
jgi:DNA-directed RNA polymerase beta' subunit